MKTLKIEFDIETLEDFHIGTGLDCVGLYDDGQLKDNEGNPHIQSETIKGLLKQSCAEVKKVFTHYDQAFKEIFSFNNIGSLDLLIKYQECHLGSPFIIHTFTQIDESGKGEKGSLRDIEFGAKGCIFNCMLYFSVKNTEYYENIKKLLELGIKNLKWIGGSRRRGFGSVNSKIISTEDKELQKDTIDHVETRIDLLLELVDDVCIAGAGEAGNHIKTLNYINGTSILGMLRNVLIKQINNETPEFLDEGKISVSNFYPTNRKTIDGAVVIPAPSSLRKNKSVNRYQDFYKSIPESADRENLPFWIVNVKTNQGTLKSFENYVSQDMLLLDKSKDSEGASDKSISDEYIIFDNKEMNLNSAMFFTPKTGLIMRNSIGLDSQKTEKDAIFTQEVLLKGNLFAGSLLFDTLKNAQAFVISFSDFLTGQQFLHVGRGGKPLQIKEFKFSNHSTNPHIIPKSDSFITLTLLSDTIMFNEKLHAESIVYSKYLDLEKELELVNYINSTRIHQSYTGLAGMRRFSDMVINKGSCFCYQIKEGYSFDDLKKKIEKLQNTGIGLKVDEGFGQIIFNLSVHDYHKDKNNNPGYNFSIADSEMPDYHKKLILKQDELMINAEEYRKMIVNKSESFSNTIIALMEAGTPKEEIERLITHNIEKETRAKKYWSDFAKIWELMLLNVNNLSIDLEEGYEIIRLCYLMIKGVK